MPHIRLRVPAKQTGIVCDKNNAVARVLPQDSAPLALSTRPIDICTTATDQTECVRAVLTYLVELHAKKTRYKVKNNEKVTDSSVRTPRASLSMSESLKVQLEQQKQASRRTSKCLLM